jgi:hypothetical protein
VSKTVAAVLVMGSLFVAVPACARGSPGTYDAMCTSFDRFSTALDADSGTVPNQEVATFLEDALRHAAAVQDDGEISTVQKLSDALDKRDTPSIKRYLNYFLTRCEPWYQHPSE